MSLLRACLSAAVLRTTDPCQPAPADSAVPTLAQPQLRPCAAGVDRLHCRTAATGWGCSPGLVLEGIGNRTGYCSPCRLGRSYIRLTCHVMMMPMMMQMMMMMIL